LPELSFFQAWGYLKRFTKTINWDWLGPSFCFESTAPPNTPKGFSGGIDLAVSKKIEIGTRHSEGDREVERLIETVEADCFLLLSSSPLHFQKRIEERYAVNYSFT
jgi:hypothetical protein